MSFSDSDWTSEAAASAAATGRRDSTWVWTLVLGVVIGAAGATLVFLMLERLSQREAPQAVAKAPLAAAAPPPPTAVIEAAPPAAGPAEPPAASAVASPAEPVPAVAPVATTVAPRPSAEEMRRKERAWAAYYKRPSSCEGNPTTDQLIECANHFIRSKRDFDERWKAGTL
jgi:hypothetical protein